MFLYTLELLEELKEHEIDDLSKDLRIKIKDKLKLRRAIKILQQNVFKNKNNQNDQNLNDTKGENNTLSSKSTTPRDDNKSFDIPITLTNQQLEKVKILNQRYEEVSKLLR